MLQRLLPIACFALALQAQDVVPTPKMSGPIPVTDKSHIFGEAKTNLTPLDLSKFGYVEEEFLISGSANVSSTAVPVANARSARRAGRPSIARTSESSPRAAAADGVHVLVELVERGVRQPSLVEMQGVDLAIQHFLDLFHVVENAVVGGLGDGQHPGLGFLVHGGDLADDGFIHGAFFRCRRGGWGENGEGKGCSQHEEGTSDSVHDDVEFQSGSWTARRWGMLQANCFSGYAFSTPFCQAGGLESL